MTPYFTVVIPFEDNPHRRTQWHPTEGVGPFSVLTRGAFPTEADAHAWAIKHLGPKATYTAKGRA